MHRHRHLSAVIAVTALAATSAPSAYAFDSRAPFVPEGPMTATAQHRSTQGAGWLIDLSAGVGLTVIGTGAVIAVRRRSVAPSLSSSTVTSGS